MGKFIFVTLGLLTILYIYMPAVITDLQFQLSFLSAYWLLSFELLGTLYFERILFEEANDT